MGKIKKQIQQFTLTIMTIVLISASSQAQWTLQGYDLDGENAGDASGNVSLSADGLTLAIGSTSNDDSAPNAGQVRVFKYSQAIDIWLQLGSSIYGDSAYDAGGYVSLSADGLSLAIGYPGSDTYGNNSGEVRVFKLISNIWEQQGTAIHGDTMASFGRSLSISADGSMVAIGAPHAGFISNVGPGYSEVYKFDQGNWIQEGATIYGDEDSDRCGRSVSLSADGSTLAVGAYSNDSIDIAAGQVRIFKNISGSWVQEGDDLYGANYWDFFGYSLSLSADGSSVAIGANSDDNGDDLGYAHIYDNVAGDWVQFGQSLYGQSINDNAAWYIGLSADGNTVVIPSVGNDNGNGLGYNCGHARVFTRENAFWNQVGSAIAGEGAQDLSGPVSINSDGTIIAYGSFNNDGNGENSGHARVFKFNSSLNISKYDFGNTFVCHPNPTKGQATIELNQHYNEITVITTDAIGKELSIAHYSSATQLHLNIEGDPGVYFIKIRKDGLEKIMKLVKN